MLLIIYVNVNVYLYVRIEFKLIVNYVNFDKFY